MSENYFKNIKQRSHTNLNLKISIINRYQNTKIENSEIIFYKLRLRMQNYINRKPETERSTNQDKSGTDKLAGSADR